MSVHNGIEKIVKQLREGTHPADVAQQLDDYSAEQKKSFFETLTAEEAARVMEEMDELEQVYSFRLLTRQRAAEILREMAADEAADLLGELTPPESKEILELAGVEAEELKELLKYAEDSAGGIMTTEFTALPEDMPTDTAIGRLREIAPNVELAYYIYVTDGEGKLKGVLSLRDLISASEDAPLREIMQRNVISVFADVDQEEVARVVSRYDLLALPVVDGGQRLLGVITVDDVIDVLEEEATEDIYRLAGTGEVEGKSIVDAGVAAIAKKRLPWLVFSLAGGLIAGSVISAFEETLEAIVMLAIFIPVIMDMGGNVGTQSSTVFIRSMGTGEIQRDGMWYYFLKEIRVGLTMGLVTGLVVAVVASYWQGMPALGLVVGLAMFVTVALAAFIGILVPIIFNLLDMDPAFAAGPFVTTIKDVTGLLIYFWMATIFLEHLI